MYVDVIENLGLDEVWVSLAVDIGECLIHAILGVAQGLKKLWEGPALS